MAAMSAEDIRECEERYDASFRDIVREYQDKLATLTAERDRYKAALGEIFTKHAFDGTNAQNSWRLARITQICRAAFAPTDTKGE